MVHDYRRILVLGLEMFLDILMVNRVVIVSIVIVGNIFNFLLLFVVERDIHSLGKIADILIILII